VNELPMTFIDKTAIVRDYYSCWFRFGLVKITDIYAKKVNFSPSFGIITLLKIKGLGKCSQ
jgi:hypothetical protein